MKEELKKFMEMMEGRLEKGHKEYGDDAFMKHNLPNEIEEEIIDICAWSFLLWVKLQRLKERLK